MAHVNQFSFDEANKRACTRKPSWVDTGSQITKSILQESRILQILYTFRIVLALLRAIYSRFSSPVRSDNNRS